MELQSSKYLDGRSNKSNDVSIPTIACKKEDAKAATQSLANSVLDWSQESKLNLNADKNETCFFSTWSNDTTWQPAPFIGNWKILVNVTPHLLSAILDRGLTFNAHLKKQTVFLSEPQDMHPGTSIVQH